jgi:hypothetical protein
MGSKPRQRCLGPSEALRAGSTQRLHTELAGYLVESQPDVEIDYRDVLVGLAPYYDCAQRLGVDPVSLFDEASQGLGQNARRLARDFARRKDITLGAFGWQLTADADGPCYQPMAT